MNDLSDLDPSEGIGVYTDGSAWNKDGSGGWAWLAIDAFDGQCEGSGGDSHTTNNRMEMTAWIEGLNAVHRALGPCEIIVFSDSEYVGMGVTERTRKRRANVDLWASLDAAVDQHLYVEFSHIKGHSGHSYNEHVDQLASQARKEFRDEKVRVATTTTKTKRSNYTRKARPVRHKR